MWRALTKRRMQLFFVVVLGTVLVLEMGLRLRHGALFDTSSLLPPPEPYRTEEARTEYDATLGWVPVPGGNDTALETVTEDGLRSSGVTNDITGRPILTIGDAWTFAEEVPDSATWTAQLGRLTGSPVLNGGVYGFGVDQAYLRALALMEKHNPEWVVFAFVNQSVQRAQRRYDSAWKPYYVMEGGVPSLRNSPVPTSPRPYSKLFWLREVLGRSYLAEAYFSRNPSRWWQFGLDNEVHRDGGTVTVELATLLQEEATRRDTKLLVVTLGMRGPAQVNAGMSAIAASLQRRGVHVLDLVPPLEAMITEGERDLFTPRGRYSTKVNAWVAERVAESLLGN